MPDLPDIAKTEAAIVVLTNQFRRGEKLGEVKPNAGLNTTARLYAEYLAKTGRFAHEADGRQPADRAKASGYKFCTIAENLALNQDSRGFKSDALAQQAIEGWKASPGHRANMVLPGVTEIGVGVAKGPDSAPKYISVQLFGRPESFKFQFKVENRAGAAVTYSAFGKSHTIEPRMIVTHTVCEPGIIDFQRSGNWLTGSEIKSKYTARDGSLFVLSSGPGGVKVTTETAGKKQGP